MQTQVHLRGRCIMMRTGHLLTFLCAFLMFFGICGQAFADSGDRVYVSVRATVKWDDTAEKHWKNEGSLSLQITGAMVRDSSKSPMVQKKGQFFRPVLTYKTETMSVSYSYNETQTSLAPMPKGMNCPLIHEYHGGGVSQIKDSAGLSIRMFSSMAASTLQNLSPAQRQFAAQMQKSMAMPDYYEFYVGGPGSEQKVQGRKINSTKRGCTYVPVEKKFRGFSIGLQMKLPESGNMSGTRTWTSDNKGVLPPSFKISLSDIGEPTKTSPYKPPEGGRRNVTYAVSWHLGDKLEIPKGKDNKEKDCEELQKRIDFIKVILKTYADQSLRDSIKNKHETNKEKEYKDYKEAVKKQVMEKTNSGSEEGPEAKDLLETTPSFKDPLCTDLVGITITGTVGGATKPLLSYDAQGNQTDDTEDFWELQKEWEEAYGKELGQELFKAAVRHEECHVRQFVKKGKVESIDDIAERELEAYRTELKDLEQSFRDHGC